MRLKSHETTVIHYAGKTSTLIFVVILNSSHDLQGKGLLNLCIYECTIILQLTEYISQMSHVYKVSRTHGIAKRQLNNSQQKHYVITQFYYNVDNTCMINSRSSPFPCIRGGH